MASEQDKELEDTYGPAAPFSEHKRGEHITYTSAEGPPGAGTIVWVCAAGIVGETPMGIRYIVETDNPSGFGLDIVWPADVRSLDSQEDQEPTLCSCPYCFGRHPSHLVEQCPLNPKAQE
jgi:hypothetical protein